MTKVLIKRQIPIELQLCLLIKVLSYSCTNCFLKTLYGMDVKKAFHHKISKLFRLSPAEAAKTKQPYRRRRP